MVIGVIDTPFLEYAKKMEVSWNRAPQIIPNHPASWGGSHGNGPRIWDTAGQERPELKQSTNNRSSEWDLMGIHES